MTGVIEIVFNKGTDKEEIEYYEPTDFFENTTLRFKIFQFLVNNPTDSKIEIRIEAPD